MLGLITPRLILVLLWVFSPDVIIGPFSGLPIPNPIVPLLGLVFLPTTTLGFCWAKVSFGGLQTFSGLVIVLTGLLIDAGLIGKGRGITRR
jgi:hypothetical protein